MIDIRRFEDLGRFQNDWLNAHYHFSFSQFHDPARMGHGKLRVWNDDTIQPDTGFPPHGHKSMEIITYVRTGAITHRDSLGNTGRTAAGDVQVMSAGHGIQHAEWNAEPDATTLFQLWILPRSQGGTPRWGTKSFPKGKRAGDWETLASGLGDTDALEIDQDARVLGATALPGTPLSYEIPAGRYGYIVAATGEGTLNGERFSARDGAAITGPARIEIDAREGMELVLVDTV
ncbi:MAG: pirin family protein [Hyphomonadaceae bacterium]|nr:pirin family protein [Hyphomonadaceae bacterium]